MTKRAIHVFLFRRPQWGPFALPACVDYMRDCGIVVTRNPLSAAIAVVPTVGHAFKGRRLLPWKNFLVYSDDPRHDRTRDRMLPVGPAPSWMHFVNALSDAVFWDNYAFCNMHGIGNPPHPAPASVSHFELRQKRLAAMVARSPALMTDPAPPNGINLHGLRVQIMEVACRMGFGRVMGAGWPAEFHSQDTGYAAEITGKILHPWSTEKLQWLSQYWFNLCFENTLAPYYVTEKIWHSVLAGCVPVYYGRGSTVSLDFPRGSFVDYADFGSPEELVRFLSLMEPSTARNIYNAAVESYLKMLMRRAATLEQVETERARRLIVKLRVVVAEDF